MNTKRIAYQFVSIMLIVVIMLSSIVTSVIQNQHKHSVWEKIRNNSVKSREIVIPSSLISEITWLNDDEFEYQKNMYDCITRSFDKNGNLILNVLGDKLDGDLQNLLVNEGAKDKTGKNLIKLLDCFSKSSTKQFDFVFKISSVQISKPIKTGNGLILKAYREIFIPPPNSFS